MGPHRHPADRPVAREAGSACPACGDSFQTLSLQGQSFDRCEGCSAIWIGREAVLGLRGGNLHEHPLLQGGEGMAVQRSRFSELNCPVCGQGMRAYDYRGGSVTVDQCAWCDHLFLDARELRTILREWDRGFELSETAKAAMMDHHIERAAAYHGTSAIVGTGIAIGLVVASIRLLHVFDVSGPWGTAGFAILIVLMVIGGVAAFFSIRKRHRRLHVKHMHKAMAYGSRDAPPEGFGRRLPASRPRTVSRDDGPKAFPKPGS